METLITIALVMLLSVCVPSVVAQGGEPGRAITLTTSVLVTDDALKSETVTLAELSTEADGSDLVLSTTWRRATVGWLPAWYIFVESDVGIIPTDLVAAGASGIRLGPIAPERGHVYDVSLSFDGQSGSAELSVWDRTADVAVIQDGWHLNAYDKPVLPRKNDNNVTVSHHPLPVATTWDIVTEASTVPTTILEPGQPAWVRLQSHAALPGHYQLVARNDAHEHIIAHTPIVAGETKTQVPADDLSIGTMDLVVQYVLDGRVLWESNPKQLRIGKIVAGVTVVNVDLDAGTIDATLHINSASPLPALDLTLKELRSGLAWEPVLGEYARTEEVENTVNLGEHSLSSESNISFSLPVPSDAGMWESTFSIVTKPAIATEMRDARFTFSTLTGDAVSNTRRPDDGSVRLCTYNIIGFHGWPEGRATPVLGNINDDKRMNHFAHSVSGLGCDILGIQEGNSVTMMRKLGWQLGMRVAAFPSATAYPGGILTRYTIRESRMYNHIGQEAQNSPFSRFAGAALLEIEGKPVWVVNIHAWPHDAQMREKEAELLGDIVSRLLQENPHVVVMGDFNSGTDGAIANTLTAMGFRNAMEIHGQIESTINTGPRAIDHIYVSEALATHVRRAWVVRAPGFSVTNVAQPGVWANSDHLPVIVELEW